MTSATSVSEKQLNWDSKPAEKKAEPIGSPATVGQAKLNVLTMGDPSHSHAYSRWTNRLRTTERGLTDQELAEAFLALTEKIGETNDRLRMTPLTDPGAPWQAEWQQNQKRAGKRDAIMEVLKNRAKERATVPAGLISKASSAPPTPPLDPAQDPFENA